jgi:hypothetical protein
MSLQNHVTYYENCDCRRCDKSLGIRSMPEGYALMLDGDGLYFFWLDQKGRTSVTHWNKWAVYKGAKIDAANPPNAS